MTFMEAIKALESGKSVKRTDWKFDERAYISLLEHNGNNFIYMLNNFVDIELYGITYDDIKSTKWEISPAAED